MSSLVLWLFAVLIACTSLVTAAVPAGKTSWKNPGLTKGEVKEEVTANLERDERVPFILDLRPQDMITPNVYRVQNGKKHKIGEEMTLVVVRKQPVVEVKADDKKKKKPATEKKKDKKTKTPKQRPGREEEEQEQVSEPQKIERRASLNCCNPFAFGAIIKSPMDFAIATNDTGGLGTDFVYNQIIVAIDEWENTTTSALFGDISFVDFFDLSAVYSGDAGNQVGFADLSDPEVLAFTVVRGIFDGPVANREILGFNMVFNTYFIFGDASIDPDVIDFISVTLHEFGHALGLDHPSTSCVNSAMFPSLGTGDYSRRVPDIDDAYCVCNLYQDPNCGQNVDNQGSGAAVSSSLAVALYSALLVFV